MYITNSEKKNARNPLNQLFPFRVAIINIYKEHLTSNAVLQLLMFGLFFFKSSSFFLSFFLSCSIKQRLVDIP